MKIKTNYRILQVEDCDFEVQMRYLFVWTTLNSHGNLESARRYIATMKYNDKNYPKVVK